MPELPSIKIRVDERFREAVKLKAYRERRSIQKIGEELFRSWLSDTEKSESLMPDAKAILVQDTGQRLWALAASIDALNAEVKRVAKELEARKRKLGID